MHLTVWKNSNFTLTSKIFSENKYTLCKIVMLKKINYFTEAFQNSLNFEKFLSFFPHCAFLQLTLFFFSSTESLIGIALKLKVYFSNHQEWYELQKYTVLECIRGQAPDSEGGSDLDKIFRGGRIFLVFALQILKPCPFKGEGVVFWTSCIEYKMSNGRF